MKTEKFDETKNRYKRKIKDVLQGNGPELFAITAVAGVMTLYAFYAIGKYNGLKIGAHGPCVEVGHEGAKGLLSGKFMVLKVVGGDVLYKLVDHDPV